MVLLNMCLCAAQQKGLWAGNRVRRASLTASVATKTERVNNPWHIPAKQACAMLVAQSCQTLCHPTP